ncbi:MAG TPA: aldo/keto reductase [Acidobacteriota bacterium]|nr:aldo/keto reductase [Acidobacteriota bacterium]
MKRRDFISTFGIGAGAAVATGIAGCGGGGETAQQAAGGNDSTKAGDSAAGIKKYAAIGATGLKMSDISMGCGALDNPYVVERALDLGINYFDTAPDYGSGQSEEALGKVFADPAKRDGCIIVSKLCKMGRYGGHFPPGTSEADLIAEVEGSLTRLQTDHIDILQVHAIAEREDDGPRLIDPEMLSAVAKLKEQGKVLHLGTTSHGPHGMEDLLIQAIESGHYEMIMAAFNFMEHPRLSEVLKKAQEHNVGVVAMKTLAGAKLEDLSGFKGETGSIPEAAFKWVFTHPEVTGLVVTMRTTAEVEFFAASSGKRFTAADQKILDQYADAVWSHYCRTGCGDCLAHCPHGVAVADVLRYDMYYTSYRDHLQALSKYHQLPAGAKPNACTSCDGPCLAGCQFGLPVRERLIQAAERLHLA